MEINPHPLKTNKSIITFENAKERFWFGCYAPAFSMESFRKSLHQIPDLDAPILLLGEFPQDTKNDFPYSVSVPHKVLGHVAGRLLISKTILPGADSDRSQMLETITNHFISEQVTSEPAVPVGTA